MRLPPATVAWTRVVTLAGVALATAVLSAMAQTDAQRITIGSNVRLRAEPSVEVHVLATAPLGADLIELDATPDGRWVRVQLPDGGEGWVAASLTRVVPAGERFGVIQRLIGERLAREGDGFGARVELLDLIERSAGDVQDAETAAEFALFRLRAIDGVVRSRTRDRRRRPAHETAWLEAHETLVVDNPIGGRWMLRHDAILAEHDRHRGTRAAQRIAWLAVGNGLRGECNGFLPCHVEWSNRLDGEYLREYPTGAFVETSFTTLIRRAASWAAEVEANDPRFFDRATECDALTAPLAALRTAVEGASGPRAYAADSVPELGALLLQLLDKVGSACAGAPVNRPVSSTASAQRGLPPEAIRSGAIAPHKIRAERR